MHIDRGARVMLVSGQDSWIDGSVQYSCKGTCGQTFLEICHIKSKGENSQISIPTKKANRIMIISKERNRFPLLDQPTYSLSPFPSNDTLLVGQCIFRSNINNSSGLKMAKSLDDKQIHEMNPKLRKRLVRCELRDRAALLASSVQLELNLVM